MGKIKESAQQVLQRDRRLPDLLRPFLHDFDVSWGDHIRVNKSTELTAFILDPNSLIRERFGVEREVMLFFADYPTVFPRTLQAAADIMGRDPARGRVEPLMYFFVGAGANIAEDVRRVVTEATQAKIPLPLALSDCLVANDEAFVRETMQKNLFSRDLFDFKQPVEDDCYFFGRKSFVLDLRDAALQGENTGLFGLRKMGKTSILLKLRRLLHEEGTAELHYFDLQDPALYELRWWALLDALSARLSEKAVCSRDGAQSSARFRQTIKEQVARTGGKRIVLALDEIEHVAPQLCMREHWNHDFLDFWKAVRAIQNENRQLTVVVAGVNATVIETDKLSGHDNPLYNMLRVRYVPAFDRPELRQMVRTFGKVMGLRFSEDAYDYLLSQYGGHPFLTRQVCSWVHRKLAGQDVRRPVDVDSAKLRATEDERDTSLFDVGNQILGMLKSWYADEYEMLRMLASGEVEFFKEAVASAPEYSKHLQEYQLVTADPPNFRVPFLKRHMVGAKSPVRVQTPEGNSSMWAEIGSLRNRLEPKLRVFVKRTLKAHLGPDRWIDPVLEAMDEKQRKQVQGVGSDEILADRIFLLTLIHVISKNWDKFKSLQAGPLDRQVTKDQINVLLTYVNAHREDAHAKDVSAAELAALRVVVEVLDAVVSRHLED